MPFVVGSATRGRDPRRQRLWSGDVDPSVTDPDTEAIRAFNDHAAADGRVELVMMPLSDGVTVARATPTRAETGYRSAGQPALRGRA
jgi:O-methyltransferase